MKLTMTTFLSLDGIMQAPGGPDEDREGGFEHGGWLVPYVDDDMFRYVTEWFEAADAFLLGRKTYEIFAAHWPRVTDPNDPIAGKLNSKPKYVASNTLDRVGWQGASLIKGDVATEVAKLKQLPGREMQVHGSGDLAQTLMANNLIDEYRLWIYPVVLRSGKRLFQEGGVPASLKLTGTRTTSTGVVVHTYEPAGDLTYGAFEVEDSVEHVKRVLDGSPG
jgi:dihydrofolate reductase